MIYLFHHYKYKGEVKDKEHLKLGFLVGPGCPPKLKPPACTITQMMNVCIVYTVKKLTSLPTDTNHPQCSVVKCTDYFCFTYLV